jgi:CubicO group peptidase (beta-lactamase class C family)
MSDARIDGTVERGFEAVREVFERNFESEDLGAAACAYVDGCKVVDLWGGWADADRTRQWQQQTIVTTFSATKGMTATCAHHLLERGLLDVDAPIAAYWPEFAQAGKQGVTVRMALNHQAGLTWATAPYPPEKWLDWDTLTDALARSAPVWEPGTRCDYHGGTFGYLVGEVLRRIDGRPLDVYFREEIGGPLGADFFIKCRTEDEPRCAEVTGPEDMVGPSNTTMWRLAGDGAATGHGTAESLARVYGALARGGDLDGIRLLRPETIEAATQEQPLAKSDGAPGDFGLGYQLLWKQFPLPKGAFGHTGMGGSIGLADPSRKLGFGFVMNRMNSGGATNLLLALYGALAR